MLTRIYHEILDTIKQWLESVHPTELTPIPIKLHTNNLESLKSLSIQQHQMLKQRYKR